MPCQLSKQVSNLDPQDFGQQSQIQNRQVAFAPLDATDERAVKVALFTKLLLGQTASGPTFADSLSQFTQKFLVVEARHS